MPLLSCCSHWTGGKGSRFLKVTWDQRLGGICRWGKRRWGAPNFTERRGHTLFFTNRGVTFFFFQHQSLLFHGKSVSYKGVGHSNNQGKLSTNMKQIGQKYFLMGLQQQFTWLLCFANPRGAKGGLTKEVAKLNLSK